MREFTFFNCEYQSMKWNVNRVGLAVAGTAIAGALIWQKGCFARSPKVTPELPLLKDFAGKDFGAPDALATQLATFCGPTPKIEQVMTCDVSAAYVPRQFYSDARADVGDDGRVRRIEVAVRLHPWARCTVTTPCDAIGAEAIAAKVVEVRAVLRHATVLV